MLREFIDFLEPNLYALLRLKKLIVIITIIYYYIIVQIYIWATNAIINQIVNNPLAMFYFQMDVTPKVNTY